MSPLYFVTEIENIDQAKKIKSELDDKIVELETMNRLMIGRELKMADLKEEIEALKKKLL